MPYLVSRVLISIFLLMAWTGITTAEEPDVAAADKSDRWLAEFSRYDIQCGDPKQGQLQLHKTPLLSWTNPTDFDITGATFLWSRGGRPAMVASGFEYDIRDERRTKHAFHSLSPHIVSVSRQSKMIWQTKTAGVQWKKMDQTGPVPGAAQRLLALRRAARRFTVEMTSHRNQKHTLRLLPTPLHRYSAAEEGVIEGAIFAFANGNDPDALLLIELHQDGGETSLHYAFARSHYYQLEAKLSDDSVWLADLDIDQQRAYLESCRSDRTTPA